MPQIREVVLRYDLTTIDDPFRAFPAQVPVEPEDTIHFRLHADTLASVEGCKLKITLANPGHFNPGVVVHGLDQNGADALVVNVRNIPGPIFAGLRAAFQNPNQRSSISAFKCELLSGSGVVLASAGTGGEIVPDTGGS